MLGKGFRTKVDAAGNSIAIVLYERIEKQKHESCYARGIFTNPDRVASVIDLWVDKLSDIEAIKKLFNELEVYKDFEFNNPDIDIDSAWKKVKNMFFNDLEFWKNREWKERYLELLEEAKRHSHLANFYSFTSHDWLRFSRHKDITETWGLDTHIMPTMYSREIPNTVGKFYVSAKDLPSGKVYFNTVRTALDFYVEKLKEAKPIKWQN